MNSNEDTFEVRRDFFWVTLARFLFSFGVQIQSVVMGWQIYDLKRDPLYLGLIGLAEALPALSLALFAGYWVDQGNPHKIYRGVLVVSEVSALILLLVSLGILGGHKTSPVYWIYGAALITGLARSFAGPSLYSMIPKLIDRSSMSRSAAWITSAFQIASVSGPAMGGILYAWKGPQFAYGVDSLLICGAFVAVSCVKYRFHSGASKSNIIRLQESWGDRLTSGLRFVFATPLLLSAMALDMFAVLFGGATALFPIFARDILEIGPQGLGWLRAATPAGAIVMSVFLIRFPIRRGGGPLLLSVVAGYGLCMIGFGLSSTLTVALIFLALSGALDSVSMVIRSAIVQLSSPDEMRGRISAVNSIFIGSSNEIGAFESGVAAKLMGTVPSVVFGGCVTLLTVAFGALFVPALRRLDIAELEKK